ncbi:hypothetical protein HS088_TW10G00696 [Tripterygium wilfordii]|uniref:Uncharacterized protein n=1 Tax=Tripterygium wilfordii TaxID=458696 RepID=A0A7J7D5U3_TRIWF|nr:hypothetical protein HS088_TW10G00696 [Tripterygium wilfordii]
MACISFWLGSLCLVIKICTIYPYLVDIYRLFLRSAIPFSYFSASWIVFLCRPEIFGIPSVLFAHCSRCRHVAASGIAGLAKRGSAFIYTLIFVFVLFKSSIDIIS